MQSYEKNRIDVRPLSEIVNTLSMTERYFLNQELQKAQISRMSLNRWLRGESTPQPSNRSVLVGIFKKMGITTSSTTLFPNK